METKNNEEYCEKVRGQLKLENSYYVRSNGLADGLALWWNQEVYIRVHHKDE